MQEDEIKNILKCLEMDMLDNKQIKILLDYITNLQEENTKLKELCNKYEEEHNTKFNEWVFDKRENERLKQIIKTANMMEYFKAYDILQGSDKE